MQGPKKTNPPVSTEMQPIELGRGLDFTRPKLLAEPGSLLDCNNFEIVDRGGVGRIAGCEPFDGQETMPYDPLTTRIVGGYSIGTKTYAVGDQLVIDGTTNVFGVITGITGPFTPGPAPMGNTFYAFYYTSINTDYEPTLGQFMNVVGQATGNKLTVGPGGYTPAAPDPSDTSVPAYTRDVANAAAAVRRNLVTSLPERPIGLHWFRDRLYAITDDQLIRFEANGGVFEPKINMFIKTGDGTNLTGRILDIHLVSGTWAGGNAQGFMRIAQLNFTGAEGDNWASNAVNVQSYVDVYPDSTFGVATASDVFTVRNPATGSLGDPPDGFASVWVCLSEAQADAEGAPAVAGWNRIDLGWEVDYELGYAESGSLTKIEKGTEPNYTPGGPTTTGATTANLLVQAPEVTGEIAQVQGWKSTAAETVFATDAVAVSADDNVYLYGDCLTYAWGLNTGGDVKTNQPSGGTGEDASIGLTPWPAAGEALTFTLPAPHATTIKGSNGYTYFLLHGFDGLATAVPSNARITGITASVKYGAQVLFDGWALTDAEIFAGFTDIRLESQLMSYDEGTNTATKLGSPKSNSLDFTFANFTENNDDVVGTARKARWTKTAESTLTYGGSTDLWGLSTITRASVASEGFTLGFRMKVDCGNAGGGSSNDNILVYRPLLDLITVTVTYVTDSVRYYFVDGSDVIQGDLVYYTTVEGTFQTSDAEGTMQLINVVKQAGTKYVIEDGMTIHTALPGTSGNQVGVVAADMTYNGLPSLASLIDNNSRYEFITANFYARDDLDGFYGVSGAGKAFSVNTFINGDDESQEYLVKITTNALDEDGDKPRHVAFHHYHLALGYSWGGVRLSVGGEPENFDGSLGAAEVGVGDKVTGLLSMKGMTLGVFCENSIWSIAGTDADNYVTQVIAPYTGALEYTVVDMGIPMYCDSRGISTIEQSATYSNFQGSRLSSPVTPWILPRMLRITDFDSEEESVGVACAIPVRAKNHYRVFFRDGKVLCTSISPDGPPAFTFSTYYIGMTDEDDTDKYLVPIAWSSQVDERGAERIHVSHYSATSTISDDDAKYVYELETGWGFAGRFIPAYFATNWYAKDPYTKKTIKEIRMEGLTLGYGSSVVTLAKEYEEVYNTTVEPISLPRNPATSIRTDYYPTSTMATVGRTGRNFSIKVADVIPTGDTITDPVPPCIHQIMLTQYSTGGETDS